MANAMNDNRKLFLELMYKARKDSKLTQSKIAHTLKKNQSYISKYENGERRLDVLEFMDAAHAIGVDPVEIISKLNRGWKKK